MNQAIYSMTHAEAIEAYVAACDMMKRADMDETITDEQYAAALATAREIMDTHLGMADLVKLVMDKRIHPRFGK